MDKTALKDHRQRVVGLRETSKEIQRGSVSGVYVAQDADGRILAELKALCISRHISLDFVDTMAELGRLCGIDVGATCAAVITRRTR